jgi:hypothetical protein
MTLEDLEVIMGDLGALYGGKKIPAAQVYAWHDRLKDLEAGTVAEAIRNLAVEEDHIPSLAKVRREAVKIRQLRNAVSNESFGPDVLPEGVLALVDFDWPTQTIAVQDNGTGRWIEDDLRRRFGIPPEAKMTVRGQPPAQFRPRRHQVPA